MASPPWPQARERGPHLVLLDIGLRGMDGFKVAHKLRLNPAMVDVPIILVSAYVTKDAPEVAAKAGILRALCSFKRVRLCCAPLKS